MRISKKIRISNQTSFKSKLLQWAQQEEFIVWLDSNEQRSLNSKEYSSFDGVLALGSHQLLELNYRNAFERLTHFHNNAKDYIFGYLGYDLKNDIEALSSNNNDNLNFKDLLFFQPKKLFFFHQNEVELRYHLDYEMDIEGDIEAILNGVNNNTYAPIKTSIVPRINKAEYLKNVQKAIQHIQRGDVYELNFCQEFYARETQIEPLEIYNKLNEISQPPFATFLRTKDKFLLSASPERFLKRVGNQIISQPIKGTIKRGINSEEDKQLKNQLAADVKERAENIMIVDLVRNDLSKIAIKGSVKVTELCKVYPFKQVHQMISTVVAEVAPTTNSINVIKDLFPMGSMTGAPKYAAMNIIENLESTKRGLYSGAVGYIAPNGDFDFNVVIRSILYNATNKYVSFSVGGAITAKSHPEKEYEECLLKARAMRQVLLDIDS
ncbi:anthranilate synthase component I family protein [Urechidicola sp. KH5]